MRRGTKILTGLTFMAAAATGCSQYEDVRGGGEQNPLYIESYRNPENFLVSSVTTADGVSRLALKGCMTFKGDGHDAVLTLGTGHGENTSGHLELFGVNEVIETDRFHAHSNIPTTSVLPDGALHDRFMSGPESFTTNSGDHSVECGHQVEAPASMRDQITGETISLEGRMFVLPGSIVSAAIQENGELGELSVIARGPNFYNR